MSTGRDDVPPGTDDVMPGAKPAQEPDEPERFHHPRTPSPAPGDRIGKWTWLVAAALGILVVPLWWWLSNLYFEGTARSLLWVDLVTFGVVFAGLWIMLRPHDRPSWRRMGFHGAAAALAFAIVAVASWSIMASQEGCDTGPALHADWTEPGVYEATQDGVPGATFIDDLGWARAYDLGDGTRLSITPDDHVYVDSPIVDWQIVAGRINDTLGQALPLTYQGLAQGTASTSC